MDWKRIFTFWYGVPFAILIVIVATLLLLPLRDVLQPATTMMLLVPVIIGVAQLSGTRASTTAAVAAFILLDLQFVPPYYRLSVANPQAWVALLVFLTVALLAGQQAGKIRGRERACRSGSLRRHPTRPPSATLCGR